MNKKIRQIYEKNEWLSCKSNRWLFCIYMAITLLLFYSYIYVDILEVTRLSFHYLDNLFSGMGRHFYTEQIMLDSFAYVKYVEPTYEFPIYILFAIWNIPLYLLERFAGVDVLNNVACLMWVKTMIILFIGIFIHSLVKLCKTIDLSDNDIVFTVILFFTSNFFITSIVEISEYDIISLCFVLYGVEAYIRKDYKMFLIMFACAIPLKFFAVLIFLPLLLLKEKNIWKLLGNLVIVMLPIMIFRLIIPCSGQPSGINLLDMLKGTNVGNLALLYAIEYYVEMVVGEVYFSVVGLGILMAMCYFIKIDKNDDIKRYSIYVCFLSYAILFVTCYTHPYWIMILVPFLHIVAVQNKKYLHVNMVLEMVMTWGLVLAQFFAFPWCFGNAIVAGGFWSKIFGARDSFEQFNMSVMIENVIGSEGLKKMSTGAQGMGSSIFVGCIIMFIMLNLPYFQKKDLPLINKWTKIENWVMPFRMISGIIIGVIPIAIYALYMRG